MASININYKNFVAGESSADYIPDKGFSPSSTNINLTKQRGRLYFGNSVTDRTQGVLTGNVIATANDRNYLGNDKYLLDDEGAFYTYLGTTLTKRQTASGTFQLGTSDLVQFNLSTYATATDTIYQLTGSDLATLASWWSGLNSNFRHPMEQVEDELFIADKNLIYFVNNAGTTGTAFTLPTETNITTLRKHQDGRTLLAFCGTTGDLNGGRTRSGEGLVFYCNPRTRLWDREVKIESQVEGSRNVGGIIYLTYGSNLGYFNGDGITFLKRLKTSTTTYSHCISNWDDTLLVRDGFGILAFTDFGQGRFWYEMYNNLETIASRHLNFVSYKGNNLILTGHAPSAGEGELNEIDPASSPQSTETGTFYSNRYDFGQEVKIKRIDVLHDASDASGGSRFTLYYRDTENVENLIFDMLGPGVSYGATRKRIQMDITTDIFQLVLKQLGETTGFKGIRIYYEAIK